MSINISIIPRLLTPLLALAATVGAPSAARADSKAQDQAIHSANFAQSNCQEESPPARCKQYAAKALARIAALPDAEQRHPKLVAAKKSLTAALARSVAALSAEERQSAAKHRVGELSDALKEFVKQNRGPLESLGWGKAGKPGGSFAFSMMDGPPELEYLKKFVRECTESMSGPMAQFQRQCPEMVNAGIEFWKDDPLNDPAHVCDLVQNRKKYWNRYVEVSLDAEMEEQFQRWRRTVERMAESGEVARVNYEAFEKASLVDAAGDGVQAIVRASGRPVPKRFSQSLDSIRSEFRAAVAQRARKVVWNGKARYRDAAIKPVLVRVAKRFGLTVKKWGVYETAWKVERNNLGIPIERTKVTSIMAKKAGESFCRTYDLVAVQEHLGGGRYGKTSVFGDGFEDFFVTKCR